MKYQLKKWALAASLCGIGLFAQAQNLSKKEMQTRLLAMEQEMATLKQALAANQQELKSARDEVALFKDKVAQIEQMTTKIAGNSGGGKGGGVNPQKQPPQLSDGIANTPKAGTDSKVLDMEKATVMTFPKMEHDFGKIAEGSSVTHVFKFKNTGNFPLTITNARGSCGCTVPKYPTTAIAPGQEGEIEVVFNSAGKQGMQQKTVTLVANTTPAETVLTIKAEVEKK